MSALDVSVRAQMLDRPADIHRGFGISYLTVAHDLTPAGHFSATAVVIYLGRVVEQWPTAAVFARPAHSYTVALLVAVPVPSPDRLVAAGAEAGSAMGLLPSCAFHLRCPHVMPVCRTIRPNPQPVGPGYSATCHLVAEGIA